jgi:hypothetical protein
VSENRLRKLKIAFKAMDEAKQALERSLKTNVSEFERARLADDCWKKAQAFSDLVASLTGVTAQKLPRPPMGQVLVKK